MEPPPNMHARCRPAEMLCIGQISCTRSDSALYAHCTSASTNLRLLHCWLNAFLLFSLACFFFLLFCPTACLFATAGWSLRPPTSFANRALLLRLRFFFVLLQINIIINTYFSLLISRNVESWKIMLQQTYCCLF